MDQTQLSSHPKNFPVDPSCPFPVGTEYYRPPVPPTKFWDEDFANIRAAGLRIVRTFMPWNWVEPVPKKFEFDDIDLMFELAAKHDLKVWFDTPVGTHMACPEWIIRRHPDMRVIWHDGKVQQDTAAGFAAHGAMVHNFDHPMWRQYVERYIRALVPRYKDHPALLVWGTWDGINFAAAWVGGDGLPPYNDYTIEKYRCWLKQRYSLDELNEHLLRRYRSWDDVDAPRSGQAPVDMMLYKRFHYENMADHLGWLADLIDRLDGKHEQRSHGAPNPRQQDEIVSPRIDGWGLSHGSGGYLSGPDPYSVADNCFGFQWSRAIGRNGRWWNEEIYSNFWGGLRPMQKRTLPTEATVFLWLTLIEGAAGAMYWQYRPEYMTFEGPGFNLASLDGAATPRLAAVQEAITQIDAIAPHLPLTIPKADVAIGFSAPSMEVFVCAGMEQWFVAAVRAVYKALWPYSISQDIVTASMDWSEYKVISLSNFAVLDEIAVTRLREVLEKPDGPRLVIDGHFGTFAGKGHWSFCPPEGLADLIDVRVEDFDIIDDRDIDAGNNIMKTNYGDYPIAQPCKYLILKPGKNVVPIARIGPDVVGVQSADRRITWFGMPLTATGDNCANQDLVLNLFKPMGIASPFSIEGDHLVAFRRQSKLGGSLIFLLNLERKTAQTTIKPLWNFTSATDLLSNRALTTSDGGFQVELPFGQVSVIHCHDS